jgi:hypothetical protein
MPLRANSRERQLGGWTEAGRGWSRGNLAVEDEEGRQLLWRARATCMCDACVSTSMRREVYWDLTGGEGSSAVPSAKRRVPGAECQVPSANDPGGSDLGIVEAGVAGVAGRQLNGEAWYPARVVWETAVGQRASGGGLCVVMILNSRRGHV